VLTPLARHYAAYQGSQFDAEGLPAYRPVTCHPE
jgi:hypothetical protein